MIAINYTNLRENLKTYCDKAVNDFETIVITRKNNENVIMLSETEYNNLQENLFVRSNAQSYKELISSIEQLEKGICKSRELIEESSENLS